MMQSDPGTPAFLWLLTICFVFPTSWGKKWPTTYYQAHTENKQKYKLCCVREKLSIPTTKYRKVRRQLE